MESNVSIFKTSVSSEEQIGKVRPYLDLLYAVRQWNFDLEDRDNILRIDSLHPVSEFVVRMMGMFGIQCEELD